MLRFRLGVTARSFSQSVGVCAPFYKEVRKPLTILGAIEEANRCLSCYDAPCAKACPADTKPDKFLRSLKYYL